MPQLPSGRHIAVKIAADFGAALDNPRQDIRSVWMFMPVNTVEDMFPWVRILWLLPDERAENPVADTGDRYMAGSLPVPGGLVECDSGFRLHQKEALMESWPVADREAFEAFVSDRVRPLMLGPALEVINAWKVWIPTATSFVMRLNYMWWLGGCHPAQEEHWQFDDPAPGQIDTFDLLAMLERFSHLTRSRNRHGELARQCYRLWAFMDNLHLACPAMQEGVGSSIKETAAHWRKSRLLDSLPEYEVETLRRQAIVEAIALWEGSADDELRELDVSGWKILQLVVVLHDARGLPNKNGGLNQ